MVPKWSPTPLPILVPVPIPGYVRQNCHEANKIVILKMVKMVPKWFQQGRNN